MRKREPGISGCIPSGSTRRRTIRESPWGCFISRISPLSGRCPGWKSGRSRWRKGFPASGPTPPFSPFCCRGSGSGYRRGIPGHPSMEVRRFGSGLGAAGEWGKKGCSPQIPLPFLYSYKSVAEGGRPRRLAGGRADSPFYAPCQPFLPTFLAAEPGEPELVYSAACSIGCLESSNGLSFRVRRSNSTGFRSFGLPRREEKGAAVPAAPFRLQKSSHRLSPWGRGRSPFAKISAGNASRTEKQKEISPEWTGKACHTKWYVSIP